MHHVSAPRLLPGSMGMPREGLRAPVAGDNMLWRCKIILQRTCIAPVHSGQAADRDPAYFGVLCGRWPVLGVSGAGGMGPGRSGRRPLKKKVGCGVLSAACGC
jgi:hypothetical protein